jgi:uncharacterized damage-inducible protein DinB
MTDNPNSTARPRWADRTFRFGQPAWMIQDFAERLSGTVARLHAMLHDVPTDLAREEIDGTWSMLQNAGHLGDVEELWLERVNDLRAGRPVFAPARPERFGQLAVAHQTRAVDAVLHYVTRRRAPFLEILRTADTSLLNVTAYHERLDTQMNLVDMAQFAAEHDDYHLLRIRVLRARLGLHPTDSL